MYLPLIRQSGKHSKAMTDAALAYDLLEKQNADTSNAIIELYTESPEFISLAKVEGDAILQRDKEDADKLQAGIDYAKKKGVIDPNFIPEPYLQIDVIGKTPDAVCDDIMNVVSNYKTSSSDDASSKGSIIVLCGLSGTGKGTTVAKLRQRLESDHEVVCWSNGNIFRSVTLLAATWCEQQPDIEGFDAEKALTKENIASFMSMLSFGQYNGKFDTRITGLNLDTFVSDIQNTDLKQPKVSKNIPTVAEVTQGEVILFASKAIKAMCDVGISILLEGREQTVNYVRTPLRFTLVLSDESLIGKRRAAQRLMAAAMNSVSKGANNDEVKKALDEHLNRMLQEIKN